MRPPTRTTRSARPSLNLYKARRSSRSGAPGPPTSHPVASAACSNNSPKPSKPQSIIIPTSATDSKVDLGTSSGSDPKPASANAPVVVCFPVLPPPTFAYENEIHSPSESLSLVNSPSLKAAGSIILGKSQRPRHRMSTWSLIRNYHKPQP